MGAPASSNTGPSSNTGVSSNTTASSHPTAAVIGGVSWNQVVDVPRLPQGRTETLEQVAGNQIITVREGQGVVKAVALRR